MGYFKNQLIAEQVELGDRVPAPRPAATHVAWNVGIVSRRWLRNVEREHRNYHRGRVATAVALATAAGIVAGFVVGVLA